MRKCTFAQSSIINRIEKINGTMIHAAQYGDSLYDDYSDWVEYTEHYEDYHDYLDGATYLDSVQ